MVSLRVVQCSFILIYFLTDFFGAILVQKINKIINKCLSKSTDYFQWILIFSQNAERYFHSWISINQTETIDFQSICFKCISPVDVWTPFGSTIFLRNFHCCLSRCTFSNGCLWVHFIFVWKIIDWLSTVTVYTIK